MVPESPSVTSLGSNSPPSPSPGSASRSLLHTSAGSQVSVNCDDVIGRSFEDQGLSREVAQFLLHSWQKSTKLQYGPHITRWVSICLRGEIDPFHPSLSFWLDHLLREFQKDKGHSYSSRNTIHSAISAIETIDGKPAGQYPLVSRLLKAVFQERQSFSRCHTTWNPELMLSHIKSLGPNEELSLIQLSRILTALMLLISGQRGQVLHLVDIRNMSITNSRVSFRIDDPLKSARVCP